MALTNPQRRKILLRYLSETFSEVPLPVQVIEDVLLPSKNAVGPMLKILAAVGSQLDAELEAYRTKINADLQQVRDDAAARIVAVDAALVE